MSDYLVSAISHWENGSSHNTDKDENDDLPTASFDTDQHPFTIDEANVVRFWCRVRYMIETLMELVKGPKRDRSFKET